MLTEEQEIFAILPFVSFSEKVILFDDFILFADSEIKRITHLNETAKTVLYNFSENQKLFVKNSYKNAQSEVTFLVPRTSIVSKTQLEDFLEIVFFYLHRGPRFSHQLFGAPNIFCREDFKYFVVQGFGDFGQLLLKKRFKFQIVESVDHLVIAPHGCENMVTRNEEVGYVYRDIHFDYQSEIFQYLSEAITKSEYRNLLRSISYFNKAASCELTDEERFVWLSAALESFFKVGKGDNKADVIKAEILKLLQSKTFKIIDRERALVLVADLIAVTYDYRSSYVHGSDSQIDNKNAERERNLKATLGKLSPVLALMNLIPNLFVHNKLPDNRIEGILNVLFNSQSLFEYVQRIYRSSADEALEKLEDSGNTMIIMAFIGTADERAISFDRNSVERCLNNILFVFARFARENQSLKFAQQVQEQINNIDFEKDPKKFKKWNDFFTQDFFDSHVPEPIFVSKLVFKKLVSLLDYDLALY